MTENTHSFYDILQFSFEEKSKRRSYSTPIGQQGSPLPIQVFIYYFILCFKNLLSLLDSIQTQ